MDKNNEGSVVTLHGVKIESPPEVRQRVADAVAKAMEIPCACGMCPECRGAYPNGEPFTNEPRCVHCKGLLSCWRPSCERKGQQTEATFEAPKKSEEDLHGRLTRLVDETFGYRPTTTIEELLTTLELELPLLKARVVEKEELVCTCPPDVVHLEPSYEVGCPVHDPNA